MSLTKFTAGAVMAVCVLGTGILTHAHAPRYTYQARVPVSYTSDAPAVRKPIDVPRHAMLSEGDKGYVVAITAAAMMVSNCNGAIDVEGSVRYAIRIGADAEPLSRAAIAATQRVIEQPFEKNDLNQEVSQLLEQTMLEIAHGFYTNKLATCMKWSNQLRSLGVLK